MFHFFEKKNKQPAPEHMNAMKDLRGYPDGELSVCLEDNLMLVRETLALASDLIIRELELTGSGGLTRRVVVLFIDGLADKELVQQFIIRPIHESNEERCDISVIERRVVSAGSVRTERSYAGLFYSLLYSSTIVLVDGESEALVVSTEGWEHRQVGAAILEPAIRGPLETFNEVLRVNTALIRRRIKDPQLALESIKIGKRSLTDVTILYLKDVANPKIVEEVKRRLQAIQTDAVMDTGEIEEYLEDNPYSPFPQIMFSERVDKTVAAILEGKVAVVLDGSPFALSMPATFVSFLYSPEDYYSKFLAATFIRWIRCIALIIALFMPSVYIALTTYHQEMLPTALMLSIAANRSGVPFPAFVEALIMEISIELLREASLRLPGSMGQTIGIVGALVIGQSAVEAGLVGPVLTIIVSFTAIGSFVIPTYNTSAAIRLLRFPIMVLAATLGIFGIVFGAAAILLHMMYLRSFGVEYLAAFAPQHLEEIDDSLLIKKPSFMMKYRQKYLKPLDFRKRR